LALASFFAFSAAAGSALAWAAFFSSAACDNGKEQHETEQEMRRPSSCTGKLLGA
jgi:hypothetical protein